LIAELSDRFEQAAWTDMILKSTERRPAPIAAAGTWADNRVGSALAGGIAPLARSGRRRIGLLMLLLSTGGGDAIILAPAGFGSPRPPMVPR
jgi:hypothetical protein